MTITTPRPCFSINSGSARAVSIINPKAFFASRADIVFIGSPRAESLHHYGNNGSFGQRLLPNANLALINLMVSIRFRSLLSELTEMRYARHSAR